MNIKIKMRTKIKFKKVELSETCILTYISYVAIFIYFRLSRSLSLSTLFFHPSFAVLIPCHNSFFYFLPFPFFSFLFLSYLLTFISTHFLYCIFSLSYHLSFFFFFFFFFSYILSSFLPSFLPSFLGLLASFLPSFLCYNLFLILFFIFALIILLLFFLLFQDLQVLLGIHTVAAILTETQENIENRNGLQKRISRKRNKDITMNTYDKIKGEKKSNDQ